VHFLVCSTRQHLSCDCCLEESKDNQKCSVVYNVQHLLYFWLTVLISWPQKGSEVLSFCLYVCLSVCLLFLKSKVWTYQIFGVSHLLLWLGSGSVAVLYVLLVLWMTCLHIMARHRWCENGVCSSPSRTTNMTLQHSLRATHWVQHWTGGRESDVCDCIEMEVHCSRNLLCVVIESTAGCFCEPSEVNCSGEVC